MNENTETGDAWAPLSRRAFLQGGALVLCGTIDRTAPAADALEKPEVRLALVTDLHYADKQAAGSRHYRQTPEKLAEAARQFRQDRPDFVIELGDMIDAADSRSKELRYLEQINDQFTELPGEKHYVLGNHCVDTLTKQEFLSTVGRRDSYYSFDVAHIHFVVLDACFRSDGAPYGRKNFHWTDANIPPAEIEWLAADLAAAQRRAIVFVHQRLDVSSGHGVKNAAEVRSVLEQAGNVLAVFQGHSHRNDYRRIGHIHYCTLVAMVEGEGPENNGYSTMRVLVDGTIRLRGFRNQAAYAWA